VAGTIGRLVHMTFDLFNGRVQVEALVIAAAMLAVAGRIAQQERGVAARTRAKGVVR
jgi:hypothetical protein